jgi:hypothetical protein
MLLPKFVAENQLPMAGCKMIAWAKPHNGNPSLFNPSPNIVPQVEERVWSGEH